MTFNCLTIFPEMFESFVSTSLCEKAIAKGIITINRINFRDYTTDKHNRVDDYPFGGGAGMLLTPQPLFDCFDALAQEQRGKSVCNIYLSPAGEPLSSQLALDLSVYDELNLLCGHYEGVDQRVLDCCIEREVSIGDYILTGGELPAMILMDCVMRYVPGVLANDESAMVESFDDSLLEYPQYTRPSEFRGMAVPPVLLSGHHKNILAWQREQAILRTLRCRPDLLESADLTEKERENIKKMQNSACNDE